ncbi:hypothetical protein SCP_0503030 [Sparassis crispa]|uniref:Uncharacterized protein n=1 Tax=Sparassis crispa TaxID=139825 RepID=A0A401GM34_9APHY|nr:hypothetical protein SCP_0503030 [Sparassis crispa]GBE83255.1 hypothetical protein SCP_0503030 [Sparassis crispa]
MVPKSVHLDLSSAEFMSPAPGPHRFPLEKRPDLMVLSFSSSEAQSHPSPCFEEVTVPESPRGEPWLQSTIASTVFHPLSTESGAKVAVCASLARSSDSSAA